MRILYVEDNPANVSLVKRVAREHELVNYIDGEEALRNFEKDNPDLVLMDIQLTGRLSGLDVVRELRQQGYTVPIIAVTAYAMIGDRERCLAAGCDDYMAKPLPIPDLLRLFERRKQELAELATLVSTVPAPEVKVEAPVTDVKSVTPPVEVKVEAPVADAKPVTPPVEVKVETPVTDAKPVTPPVEVKVETPVTDAKPVTPPAEVKVEAPVTDAKPVTPQTDVKSEASAIDAKPPTPPVEVKSDTPVTDAQSVTPPTEVKAEVLATDTPKTGDAPKADAPNTSSEKGEGDIKVTP